MAVNQNAGGYGLNPTDPRAEFMTGEWQTRPTMDPILQSMTVEPGFNNGMYGGASTNAQVAAAGLRRDDVPTGLLGLNSASFLGGAGGPNMAGNAQVAKPAQQPTGATPSNDQYINTGTSWIRNPDFNPLAELRGGAMQAYQQDHSIADKMGYQENGVGNAGYDPEFLRQTRRQLDMAGGMDNFFGSTANATQEQLNLQNALRGITADPFAGQNLNDASVQAHMREYAQANPGYVPVNTYRGEAPRLPGQYNQDTGQMTTEQGSANPYATNRGFVQPMQQQQQPAYQQPQQAQQNANPYLQPFQQTNAYNQSVGQNWGGGTQPQNQYQNQPRQPQGFQQPQQSQQGLLQRFQGQTQQQQPQGNRYGLLSAYGAR